jgi:branched-chain amino acid aminotransferase
MLAKGKSIWFDGKLIPWNEARVHVLTHALHYGTAYFEGIRCYALDNGRSALFRLEEHIRRFYDSGQILGFPLPFGVEEIGRAVVETVRANGLKECYVRPLAFLGEGEMGLYTSNNPVHVAIAAWPWGAYLGDDGIRDGIRAKISSFSRHHVNVMMTKSKVAGNYVNSVLAKNEVKKSGFDEAIMLDTEGYVAEGSGENIFMVRRNGLKTTPLTSILPGITRDSVVAIALDKGYEVTEERFTRDELYTADEAFFTGTAAELTPVREIDNRRIGGRCPGPVTLDLQQTFFSVIKGRDEKYAGWLTYV